MAEERGGQRNLSTASWTKIFSAFQVALDFKKLLLAAGGILVMAVGWYVLAVVFYSFRSSPPGLAEENEAAWLTFKEQRRTWNLLHEMAGNPKSEILVNAGDIADTLDEYLALQTIEQAMSQRSQPVEIKVKDSEGTLTIEKKDYAFSSSKKEDLARLAKLDKVKADQIQVVNRGGDTEKATVSVGGITITLESNAKGLLAYVDGLKSLEQIQEEFAREGGSAKENALALYKDRLGYKALKKPAGKLRTWPWHEDRGPNPYLLVTGKTKPWDRGQFFTWLLGDQVPVLLEPLVKFLKPVVYLLDSAAGFWNRIYLVLVILWTLATWALFGGAITRMAVVQVARPNEKIGLGEAFRFARGKFRSYLSAPLIPLVFIAGMTVFLIVFGAVQGFTYFFGDIVVAGLLWPIVLVVGLGMAVVLVGLVGWPLMYATISAEGSDAFDALSRSYSYVFQKPWHYLWNWLVALLYGAVLVFFIGFMGSLLVYMGKWGVSQAPFLQSRDPAKDREPTYLFIHAPTSFGWRDLMLSKSQFSKRKDEVSPSGVHTETYSLSKEYKDHVGTTNNIGAWMVSGWLYVMFLLVVGFGYSYFWTASSIIYLLMRQKVDDTELDEIHLEEGDEESFLPPAPTTTTAKATAPPVGLSMVDPPALRANPPPSASPISPGTAGGNAPPGDNPQTPPADGSSPSGGH